MRGGKVVLLERVRSEIEELIMRVLRRGGRNVMIDHFPPAIAVARPVVAAMRRVRVVHQKGLGPVAIGLAGKQRVEPQAVDRMAGRWSGSGDVQDRWKQ